MSFSATPSTTARASGRSLTPCRVSVSHEPIAPVPSTMPPDQLCSRHGALAAWPATTSPPRRSTVPATRRRAARLYGAARHPAPLVAHSRITRPMPSCPRAGFAGAWGHPRAEAKGRARGPHHAAPTWGATGALLSGEVGGAASSARAEPNHGTCSGCRTPTSSKTLVENV